MSKVATKTNSVLLAVTTIIFLFIGFESPASSLETACGYAQPIELDSTWRGHLAGAAKSRIFRLDVPAAATYIAWLLRGWWRIWAASSIRPQGAN